MTREEMILIAFGALQDTRRTYGADFRVTTDAIAQLIDAIEAEDADERFRALNRVTSACEDAKAKREAEARRSRATAEYVIRRKQQAEEHAREWGLWVGKRGVYIASRFGKTQTESDAVCIKATKTRATWEYTKDDKTYTFTSHAFDRFKHERDEKVTLGKYGKEMISMYSRVKIEPNTTEERANVSEDLVRYYVEKNS